MWAERGNICFEFIFTISPTRLPILSSRKFKKNLWLDFFSFIIKSGLLDHIIVLLKCWHTIFSHWY